MELSTYRVGVLADRVRGIAKSAGGRVFVGIAGAPGVGKTTLAEALVRSLAASPPTGRADTWVAHVPMDGFHLADIELERRGLRHRKGVPATFDVDGYVALLERLRSSADEVVYAPMFERGLEQPVAGALRIEPDCRVVVSEGNYLLAQEGPWSRVRACFDEIWFLADDDAARRRRLLARHVEFGKSPAEADAWVRVNDDPNAALVAVGAARAHLVIDAATLAPT